jgi:DNA-binding transcriptional regulator/RsmH inhibitor MraZ
MAAKLTLDKAGRVLVPKRIRPKAVLKKERGVWIYQGEPTKVSITAVIARERMKRLTP